ncbi:tubulin nucleotide-binding domain-like protein [Neofusicoccum parvum]|uniref:Tubulin nucleotide-binding domain-like protein n=1 Tax=Neofusicoccum parvum TaxID=310453 RepID=A0ACB5SME5_9PEZI|nr:tubulin nucleotide-binding domain-like protein [Neofusicoccum parvum]
MHEIVTLQFGQQANYLGSHFWNTQESYFTYDDPDNTSSAAKAPEPSPVDHDINFRPGIGADGSDTYMPRAVIYDLKGAFGSMRKINALYEPEDVGDAALWPGSTITHRAPTIPPSAYQQALDAGLQSPALAKETVRYWSDYSRVYYHPKSLVQLHEYELQSQLMPFEGWGVGEELFAGLDKEHDLLDRDLRPFIEECDQLQGLQVLSSVDDAWGGFSSRYVERLRDEFGKLSIWVWGLEEEEKKTRARLPSPQPETPLLTHHLHQQDKKLLQLTNHARSLHAISPNSSAYIPLAATPTALPPYLQTLDPASRWHTSALQATALESATLPTRLRAAISPLAHLEAVINANGTRRIAAAHLSVADPAALAQTLAARMEDEKNQTGNEEAEELDRDNAFDVALSRLGPAPRKPARDALFGRVECLRGGWEAGARVEALNRRARDRWAGGPVVERWGTETLFPLLDSFPRIFGVGGESVAVRTALATSSGLAGGLRAMGGLVGRVVGVEEREDLADGLMAMADEYEEGWDGGLEDSEDDE